MHRIRAWLEGVPLTDPVERRTAVTVQVLAGVGFLWIAASVTAAVLRPDVRLSDPIPVLQLVIAAALVCALVLLRWGHYGAALRLCLAGLTGPTAVVLADGLSFGTPALPLAAVVMATAALVLGRRALWTVLAVYLVALAVGTLRDHGYLGGPGPQEAYVPPLGTLGAAGLALVVLGIVLDGLGSALRDAARAAVERQRELLDSDERFRVAFAMSPDAVNISRVDDGVYVAVNEGFTRLVGWREDEMVGHTSTERRLWVDEGQRARILERLAAGAPLYDAECTFRHKDGHVVSGLISSRPITVAGERYYLSITRDVTMRKRAEAERVALQEQLRHAQKMEAIGRLAGGVAHDFNNILTSILACSELMTYSLAPGHSALAEAEQIRQDALRAAALTKQLLALARRQVSEPRVTHIDEHARGMEAMIRRVLGESVALETRYGPDGWPVFVDPSHLEQVILNLAVNARDALPSGGRVTLATRNVSLGADEAARLELEAGDYVLLSVADDGVGIEPEVLSRMFEPFFTTKGGRGVGLGLATCYGIVKQAGGAIAVESTPGAGSSFSIYLPRTTAKAVAGEHGAVPSARGHETVLLVEDDPAVRRVAARALGSLGYRVLEAETRVGAEKLAREHEGDIDAAVLDVALPDGSGRDVAQTLATVRPRTRVLFVSGYAGDLVSHEGVLAPTVAFLSKPYAPEQLARRLRALLDDPERRTPA